MNITFRIEPPTAHYAVEEMTRDAFWNFWEDDRTICDEHLLVHKLRTCASFIPELNYIAEVEGNIAGHIIFTKSKIKDSAGNSHETLTFGPLTVLPKFQGKGIGKALMQHAFDKAKFLGFRAVIIYGIPDYYPRIGFRRAIEFNITTPDGSVFDALLVYPLYDGALDGISGKYYIDPVYAELTQKEALEFDKKFPPKKPHIPVSIDVLLKRLDLKAVKAIKEKGFLTLDVIKSQSEREIALLLGMDENAVETVRSVMREHGYQWGS